MIERAMYPTDMAQSAIHSTRGRARSAGVLAAGITVVSWASAFVAIRVALRSFPAEEIAWLRFLAASSVLGVIAVVTRMPRPAVRDLGRIAGLGLIGHALYNLALARGQTQVPAATASFIIASAPIWMVLFSVALRHERPKLAPIVGMLVSFSGVALIALGRAGHLVLDWPALIVVAAAAMQAAYSVGQRPLLARYSALQVSTFTVFAGLLWLSPFAPSALRHLAERPLKHGAAALFLGVVPTAVGYSTWAMALKHLAPSAAGAFLYLVPGVVLLMAWLILGELPAVLAAAGGLLVVVGVVVVQRATRAGARS